MFVYLAQITLRNVAVEDTASRSGGSVHLSSLQHSNSLTLEQTTFLRFKAVDRFRETLGGAIFADGYSVLVSGCAFSHGEAMQGAVLYAVSCSLRVKNSTFRHNIGLKSGAIKLIGNLPSAFALESRCRFLNFCFFFN